MHNIKDIRNNFDNFKNIVKSRNISIDLDEILLLDKKYRIRIPIMTINNITFIVKFIIF